mgnify:CR=1 FL=1
MASSEVDEAAFLERALHMLSLRDHSCQELRQKLVARGCPLEVARHIIERCLDWKYLDDERYAERFVKMKALGGWGSRRIYSELLRRGIEAEVARRACAPIQEDGESELASALALATKKAASGRNYAAICRFLASRGFPVEIVLKAAAQVFQLEPSEE